MYVFCSFCETKNGGVFICIVLIVVVSLFLLSENVLE